MTILTISSSQNEQIPAYADSAWSVEFAKGRVSTQTKTNYWPDYYPYIGAIRLVRGGSGWEPFDGVSDRLFWSDFDGPPAIPTVH